MIKLTLQQIDELAEAVYGQLHLADEAAYPNWGTIGESLQGDFKAFCYAWLATFRQGHKLELAFDAGLPGLVWKYAGLLTGFPLGDRNNYVQLELPVVTGDFRGAVVAAMTAIEGKKEEKADAGPEVPTTNPPAENKARRKG